MALSELIEAIGEKQTTLDVFLELKKACAVVGLPRFLVLDLSEQEQTSLREHTLVTNWEPELLQAFDENGLMPGSPLLKLLRESNRPVPFDIDALAEQRDDAAAGTLVRAMFRDYAMSRGYYFPVRAGPGLRGAVSFLGETADVPDDIVAQMHAYSLYVFDQLVNVIKASSKGERLKLSERELECLRWTAEGKTSQEIAVILSLSGHTVNHYITSATTKLDAVSRAHAVAKAIRRGLI